MVFSPGPSQSSRERVWVSLDLVESSVAQKPFKPRKRTRGDQVWPFCRALVLQQQAKQVVTLRIDDPNVPRSLIDAQVEVKVHHGTLFTANYWEYAPNSLPPTDLTKLEQLHEPAVVHCLRERYQNDQIYTFSGKILLALNPFRSLPLYGQTVMQKYYSNPTIFHSDPHIYAIAEAAYRNAIENKQNQSILVSGESGAGKTISTKFILKYVAILSQKSESATHGIESQLLQSNPILESFGNARTVRNDNSSRFGKFIQIQLDDAGCLHSATIQTYLLEKVRLLSQAPQERNYHVFYEILVGLGQKERRSILLKNKNYMDFRITAASGTYDRRDGVQDLETFQDLRSAMSTVGFPAEAQLDLFQVVAAVLYISNLTFVEESADSCCLDATNPDLQCAVNLLGVEADALNTALCSVAIEARGEVLFKKNNVERAEKAKEALVKSTYSALFHFIVKFINESINTNEKTDRTTSIGVLDIFGFESFQRNSFEQLCINYCNEALQQQFNRFVFKLEQEEYQQEGIDWSFIEFPDNQDVLDLIEKKHDGILSVLDEQSRLPRCTDATFASAIYQKCQAHPRFEATKSMQADLSFAVKHYAGLVEYDTENFLEKNKDELPKETTELLESSHHPFFALLGRELTEMNESSASSAASSKSKSRRNPIQRVPSSLMRDSVGTQFCAQLKVLRTRIESTEPHYVRCLKPNDELQPQNFNALVIADQLRCAGVLEAIRVSRVGFPNRYYHEHFVQRYGILEPSVVSEHQRRGTRPKDVCRILVDLLNPPIVKLMQENGDLDEGAAEAHRRSGMQMGKTKVFIRRRTYETLEQLRAKMYRISAIKIQSVVRMFLCRIEYEIAIYAVTLIQKFVRKTQASRLFRVMRVDNAICTIQRAYRCYVARRIFLSAKYIACWLQSAFRGSIARQYCAYLFLDQKASVIQRSWRSCVYSGSFRTFRKAVITLQTRFRVRKACRELWRLRREARDVSLIAAERDRFKEESKRLRLELEEAKASPDKSSPGKDPEVEFLRSEVLTLQLQLDDARKVSSPTKSVTERALVLEDELDRRERELLALRREVAVLKLRDSTSIKSLTIETKDAGPTSSVTGSFAGPKPLRSPARSDISLLDEDADSEDEARSPLSIASQDVAGNELGHLHGAIRRADRKKFDHVLRRTTEVCVLVNEGDKYGRSAIHVAALSSDTYMAEKLIEKGAVVNAQDEDGETPLHLAETADMVLLLLRKGKANANIPNIDGICALHLAVQRRDIDCVRALVMNNANVNNADNIRWFTALHLISLPGRKDDKVSDPETRSNIAHLLTGEFGHTKPDLNYQDSEGNAPLHYAVQLETDDACDLVNVFLEKGANPNLRNMRDQVPLHLLCHNDALRKHENYIQCVHALLMHGADASAQSRTGCTPLHLSLYHKDIDTAVQLVRGGAQLHQLWKKPKRWEVFWIDREPNGVLALDMVQEEADLRRILSAVTNAQELAPSRRCCMSCKSTLRSKSRTTHCRNCGRLVCEKCTGACLSAEYFSKQLDLTEPAWSCNACEKILTSHREVLSSTTQPTSSYGDDDEDRYSC